MVRLGKTPHVKRAGNTREPVQTKWLLQGQTRAWQMNFSGELFVKNRSDVTSSPSQQELDQVCKVLHKVTCQKSAGQTLLVAE